MALVGSVALGAGVFAPAFMVTGLVSVGIPVAACVLMQLPESFHNFYWRKFELI